MVYSEEAGFRLSPKEKKLIQEFEKRKIPFLVVGLSAALIQGAPVTTQDIDLWFKEVGTEEFKNAVSESGGIYVSSIAMNPPMIAGEGLENIDLIISMSGLSDFEEEFKNAISVTLEGIPVKVLPLEKIIQSKKAAGREKDKMVLYALEAALNVIREEKKS